MGQQEAVYAWQQLLQTHLPCLSKPQVKALALFSIGTLLARHCHLERIAQVLVPAQDCPNLVRRLQRFLDSATLKYADVCTALTRWVLTALAPGGVVVLLVDETAIKDRLRVMALALAYRGRAIPLAWKCYPDKKGRERQVKVITDLFDMVAPAIPAASTVLVEADRGIGTSPALISQIEQRHWYYLFRVQRQVRVRLEDGQVLAIADLVSRPGQRYDGKVDAFKKAGWRSLRVTCQWHRKHKQAWLLVTNSEWIRANHYGIRMWEEEAFRDLKSGGFQWQHSHVYNPEHANNLWLIMAIAYLKAIAYGEYARRRPNLAKQLGLHRHRDHSLFGLGLRLLQLLLPQGPPPLDDIHLAYPPLRLKTVV